MTSSWTVRQAVDRIVELGLVDEQAVRKLRPDDLDQTLDYYGETDGYAVLALLSNPQ